MHSLCDNKVNVHVDSYIARCVRCLRNDGGSLVFTGVERGVLTDRLKWGPSVEGARQG